MHRDPGAFARGVMWLSIMMCVAVSSFGLPTDGLYTGTTDQGRTFEIRVSGGRVDQWTIDFELSCEHGSAGGGVQTTITPGCEVVEDGSFSCGSAQCVAGNSFDSEVSGQFFDDDTVAGTITVLVNFGGTSCCESEIGFEASLGGGLGSSDYTYFVAAIAHTRGVGASLWRSKLGVLNLSGSRAEVTLSYIHDGVVSTASETIDHGVLKTWEDTVAGLFGVSGNSSGSLLIGSTQPLIITARTYTEGVDGSYGSFMPAVTATAGIGEGDVGALSQLCGNDDFRSNAGFVNLGGATCQVQIQLHGASGDEIGAPLSLTLGPRGFDQINDLFAAAGAPSRKNAYAEVVVLTPDCEVWGYASVIDGSAAFPGTDDATVVPISRVYSTASYNPRVVVFVSSDFYGSQDAIGWDWIPGSTVTLRIDNGADGTIDFERSTTAGDDGEVRFQEYDGTHVFDIAEGDIVRMSDGVVSITYPVLYLTLDTENRDDDTLSGSARAGTVIYVHVYDPALPHPSAHTIQVVADSNDRWSVDFTGTYDIVADSTGVVGTLSPDRGSTAIGW